MSAYVSAKAFEAAVAAMNAPRAKTAAPVRPALDVTKARGYSPALGAIYSPVDTIDFLNAELAAKGVIGERIETCVVRDDGSVIKGHYFVYGGKSQAQRVAA